MKRTYVLDASAILIFLYKDPGGLRVVELLKEASRGGIELLVSVVNWGEVYYQSRRRNDEESATRTMADLARLSLRIVPVDLSQALKAGEIKVLHQVPYVDSLTAALAALNQATLVTSDRDFEKLGRHFPVLWLARR